MTPRRFLFATIGYPPFMGGAQVYVQQLAESLVKDGHQVTVLTTDAGEAERIWDPHRRGLLAALEEQAGVLVHRLPLRYLPGAPYSYYGLRRLTVVLAQVPGVPEGALWPLARLTPWLPGLRGALAACSPAPDLVHTFAIPFEVILGTAAGYAASLGVPHVVSPFLHAGPPEDPSVQHGYAMPHQLSLMRQASAVITLTDIERGFLLKKGLQPDKVHTVPGGILINGARALSNVPAGKSPGAPPPNVLFLGAVTYEKGAVHLVEAARSLWRDGVEVEVTLAGAASEQFLRYYKGLPQDQRIRIHLPGAVSEVQKGELLAACTALVLCSRVDSFGLVLLEAWAHAKPVIGARAGGIPEVVDDGENGLLVPFGDVANLAAAVRRLLAHPAEATRLGANGRKKLKERYSWDRIYPQITRVYERVLGQ